jgi:hypothetical protein
MRKGAHTGAPLQRIPYRGNQAWAEAIAGMRSFCPG